MEEISYKDCLNWDNIISEAADQLRTLNFKPDYIFMHKKDAKPILLGIKQRNVVRRLKNISKQ